MNGKTVLVTGGAGFIGSNFVRYLLGKYPSCKVINIDKLTYAGNLDNLQDLQQDPRHVFVQADIADPVKIEQLFQEWKSWLILLQNPITTGRFLIRNFFWRLMFWALRIC